MILISAGNMKPQAIFEHLLVNRAGCNSQSAARTNCIEDTSTKLMRPRNAMFADRCSRVSKIHAAVNEVPDSTSTAKEATAAILCHAQYPGSWVALRCSEAMFKRIFRIARHAWSRCLPFPPSDRFPICSFVVAVK